MKTLTLTILFLISSLASAQYARQTAFTNLTFDLPVGLYHAGDGTNRIFVVEQDGRIKVFPNNPAQSTTKMFLDITDSTEPGGEKGLLGLAFHPDFETNRYFYVDYLRGNPLRTIVSRFEVSASNPDSAIRSSELVLLEINQPYENHNGGQIGFGPDGYLYVAMGDGGSLGDPQNNAQNKSVLLGKILRINVDSAANGNNYAIPPSNPFFGNGSGFREEIFAYGLRNPWRFSFDHPGGGTLWTADVGQGTWEEIDTIRNGANMGWPILEGTHCYNSCDSTGLDMPVFEYSHSSGRCSITGGFVYRGATVPSLTGKYIYGDYCTGEVWVLSRTGGIINTYLFDVNTSISSFGVDQSNELYVCGIYDGRIYRMILTSPPVPTLVSPENNAVGENLPPTLIWRTSESATTYRLQVSLDSNFTAIVFDDSTITDTLKQVSGLSYTTKYYWRVRAKNGAGNSAYSAKRNFTTEESPNPPPAPVLSSPSDGAIGQSTLLTLTWENNSATSYHVQVSLDSQFLSSYVDDSLLTGPSHQISGLATGTTYFWHVRGRNASGYGDFSVIWSFTTDDQYTGSYHVNKSWNIISVPLNVEDGRKTVLFPTATSDAFAYDPVNGYLQKDTLVPGIGYWIKFADSQQVGITGSPQQLDTIDIETGWNMIGSISTPILVDSIIQDPPGILASQFFDYNSGYSAVVTLEPSRGYWVKANAPGKLIMSTGAVQIGEATFYTFADGSGNCMYDATPNDLMVGAMNEADYDNSNICGSCVTINGPDGKINVRIVDRCPGCPQGGIDLSPLAFSMIADTARGRVPISWYLIPCTVDGPVVYRFKDGSSQWWTAVQVRNHRHPIAKFEYLTNAGTFQEVNRVSYNYFVQSGGMGPGPYTFRITDIYGHIITDSGIPLIDNGEVSGGSQFPEIEP